LYRLKVGVVDPLLVEEMSQSLFGSSVRAAAKDGSRRNHLKYSGTTARRLRQIDAVKEAISLYPEREWTLASLAQIANVSTFHLTRIFRAEVGLPVHQYLLRTRLARGLNAVLAANTDLTDIALESGFFSHSHFTASFRIHFGVTPSELRAGNNVRAKRELCKNLMA
jgi:AraC-like DNA-binding protein